MSPPRQSKERRPRKVSPPEPPQKPGFRERLDLWWPTVVRYAGLALAGYEVGIDDFQNPSALVLAGGMMGLKEVLDTRKKGGPE
jgi:hypothetical protein